MAGYATTPLAKKLGIKAGYTIKLVNAPAYYFDLFTDMPPNTVIVDDKKQKKDFIHFFTNAEEELYSVLPRLKNELLPNGILWVSWPKKSSKMATSVGEDMIRDAAIKNGLVDVKVCAVDEVWSGLKLVIPVRERNNI